MAVDSTGASCTPTACPCCVNHAPTTPPTLAPLPPSTPRRGTVTAAAQLSHAGGYYDHPQPQQQPPLTPCAAHTQHDTHASKRVLVPLRVLANDKPHCRVVLAAVASRAPTPSHTHTHTHTNTGASVSSPPSVSVCARSPAAAAEVSTMPAACQGLSSVPRSSSQKQKPVIVKCCDIDHPEAAESARRELAALRRLNECPPHPNVVGLLDVLKDDRRVYLVMPYVRGGDLFEKIKGTAKGLSPPEARRYFQHIVQGLLHLKSLGIAHGDVSLENVMLSSDDDDNDSSDDMVDDGPVARLIDLGSSYILDNAQTKLSLDEYHFRGKMSYMPPEMVLPSDDPQGIDPYAIDVWGLGVCLYALLTGRPLYVAPSDQAFLVVCEDRVEELLEHYGSFGLGLDPLAHDLVCRMLTVDPAHRPTLEQVWTHPWAQAEML